MATISREILREIQDEARIYMRAIKGDNISRDDIIAAENLMVFGYKRALDDRQKSLKETQTVKENMEAINSEWD